MARVKRGVTAHRRHKKVLRFTKGHRGTKHSLYRRAHESMLHALAYSYAHRRELKGDMRRLWVVRILLATPEDALPLSEIYEQVSNLWLTSAWSPSLNIGAMRRLLDHAESQGITRA